MNSKVLAVLASTTAIIVTVSLFSSCGKPEFDNQAEEANAAPVPYPGFRGQEFHGDKNFANLINSFSQGKAVPTPWAGYWWPYTQNGIAAGTYGAGLSPAGKYDAARGFTQAQRWEVENHGTKDPKVQGWWGHCNGWTAASALFPEPRQAVRVNGVTFEIADLKALLTEAAMETGADFYGERVDFGQDYNSPKYHDTVPDQVFLILTNYMGRLKQAVLLDRYTGDQVWNQPLAGYRFEYPKPADYLGADPRAPGVYRILLTLTLWWMRDDVAPGVQTPPFNFEDTDLVESRALKMEVWVDAPIVFSPDGKVQSSGNVIVTRENDFFAGGAWRMGDGILVDAWPDYMWIPYSVLKPTDYANYYVDINWIRDHLLVPGGRDDTSASPRPIDPAPSVRPSAFPSNWPNFPLPTNPPTSRPTGLPTWLPTSPPSEPTSRPTWAPTPGPAIPIPAPQPVPRPQPRPT